VLTLYAWSTPNGYKPMILLEELGLRHSLVRVDLRAEEQKTTAFLAINPNGKIPVLYDSDTDLTVFESGAILLHLAEQHGRFLPTDPAGRAATLTWLFFQMASVGPMLGQAAHFKSRKDSSPYAWKRFHDEGRWILGVLDQRLASVPYLAGAEYSIADIATWPWIRIVDHFDMDLVEYPHLQAWKERIGARPAVQRAMAVSFVAKEQPPASTPVATPPT